VFRRDLYERHLGAACNSPSGVRSYDDVEFDPEHPEAYLQRFSIRTPFVAPASEVR
jgi:hypothetical protein